MVVKGRDGLLLYETKEQGQARPKSRATASKLFRTLVKSFAVIKVDTSSWGTATYVSTDLR